MRYIVLICFTTWGQDSYPEIHDLSITISGIKTLDGRIQIGLYNEKGSFPHADEQYKLYFIDVNEFSEIYIIKDLPKGEYAVAVFHDRNSDGICNTNFLGIPREGFGFSKNFKPRLFIPTFNDCKIDLNSNMSITIGLIYR
jgi:uncharacterized protein (DUF2141 family)